MSGIVFVFDSKIVAEVSIPYEPERPEKLQFSLKKKLDDPNCASFSLETAIFKAQKEMIDGKTYYVLNRST
ncbi:hypothetical protein ACFSR7_24980 [Cohnella sp. GCM10020058]|uniref:hypothetical protein n=1 Tax=Cohnella sp. GCM10020058 TaxID=3317330 RepID=UPI0036389543